MVYYEYGAPWKSQVSGICSFYLFCSYTSFARNIETVNDVLVKNFIHELCRRWGWFT